MLIFSALAALNSFTGKLRRTEEGQGLVEYALILVLVAVVVIVILSTLGGTIYNGLYRGGVCQLGNALANNTSACAGL